MNGLGEMWGDNAFQAQCCIVASNRPDVEGIRRALFGGVVLDDFCLQNKKWERWRGTAIFIPSVIEVSDLGWRLDQMVVESLNIEWDNYKLKRHPKDSIWKPLWIKT